MNTLMSLCRFHNDIEAVDLSAQVGYYLSLFFADPEIENDNHDQNHKQNVEIHK
jgi:hypothetical protein